MTTDDYLWDKTGDPDPDVVRLEEALGDLRHVGAPRRPPARRTWLLPLIAVAAVLVIGFVLLLQDPPAPDAWTYTRTDDDGTHDGSLVVGDWLETRPGETARLKIADIGHLTLDPESRLRLHATHQSGHRVELARGRIEALVAAPPRLFVVDTAVATAIDMGCAYALEVDDDGNGRLDVRVGMVYLERDGFESRVPAGARCLMRRGGIGTPHFPGATHVLREELHHFDTSGMDAPRFRRLLTAARSADTLTLWHLVPRTIGMARASVVDRITELSKLPDEVSRSGLLAGEETALNACWDALRWTWR